MSSLYSGEDAVFERARTEKAPAISKPTSHKMSSTKVDRQTGQSNSVREFIPQDHSLPPPTEAIGEGTGLTPTKTGRPRKPAAKPGYTQDFLAPAVAELDVGRPCLQCRMRCTTGFVKHEWRHTCVTCACPRFNHDVLLSGHVTLEEKMGQVATDEMEKKKNRAFELGYSWIPEGLNDKQVDAYFAKLPEEMVPRLDSVGEKERDRQLVLQLPSCDFFREQCSTLALGGEENFVEIKNFREQQAFGKGRARQLTVKTECQKCEKKMTKGEFGIVCEKFGPDVAWHPLCFLCHKCEMPLVDLGFFWRDGFLFCGRHWVELLRPRCATCDQIICCNEVTQGGMNNSQEHHPGHYTCWHCSRSLSGQRYIMRESNSYCVDCYESLFANSCESCGHKIGTDSKDLSYHEAHWHERCFKCDTCAVPLADKLFGSKDGQLYCDGCYDDKFGVKCDACALVFKAGTKKLEWNGMAWHEHCFKCTNCQNQIGCNSFMPKDNEPYCTACFNDLFSPKCRQCNKMISTGGVLYRNQPYHRECFGCANCSTNLVGKKFTSRENRPYCEECFGQLFAKKCDTCTKPITGIGGSKFMSFDGRHWHNDCFNCNECGNNLVGRGFLLEQERDILCSDCAKKLEAASNQG